MRDTAGTGGKAILWALAIIAVDLATKALAVVVAGDRDLGPITPRTNPDFALGIVSLNANPVVLALLLICGVAVAAHTVVLVHRRELGVLPGVMIWAGAFANALDRVVSGAVHDFINLGVAIANVADVAIVGGAVCYLYTAWNSFDDPAPANTVVS